MFGPFLETEDEGEYVRDTSCPDFANFDVRTEMENTNLRPEESKELLVILISFADFILCSRIS